MNRRGLIKGSVGVAAGTIAAPAIVHAQAAFRWRLVTSWPKSLDTIHGTAEAWARRVGQMTDGKLQISVHAAGELVPALQVFDAVQNGTVECGHTYSAFYIGKNTAYAFDGGLAFGMNGRQQCAWYHQGGGRELLNELYAKAGLVSLVVGNLGVQMGGWYRKEIKTVDDLKGLKFRIGGLGGTIMAKLGIVAQQLPAGDIYAALERGTIDAAEFIGPYDDEKLGLHKAAKFYYTPGWWEGSAQNSVYINAKQWEALPQAYRDICEAAATEQTLMMLARYDSKNPEAMRRLVAAGVQLRQFPREVMDACYKASFETFEELAAKNPDFKKIYGPWLDFLQESNLWFRVAEANLDNYRYSQPVKKL